MFRATLAALFLLPIATAAADRPIVLTVDATEAPRKLLHARLVIPAAPGPLTLYYPKWIPGEHSPSGPINDLSGLKLSAGGKSLAWRRDDVDLYAFHCEVPEGADAVEVSLDYLGSTAKEGYTSGASMTARLAILNWNWVVVYPKDRPVSELQVRAGLTVPPNWKIGTVLPVETTKDSVTEFKPVSLETLVDSPVVCAAHLKEVPLGEKEGRPHFLVLACDSAVGLELSDELKGHYERLVAEAGALFGARHYRSYRFLVTMSDHIRSDGIEHHECSDNRLPERFLVDDSYRKHWYAWLLAHEYVHSWNGKYRSPAGLVSGVTADYQEPINSDLLWVYEGLTEYYGDVLGGRSGLRTPELYRENLALLGAAMDHQAGRSWRPLVDTATAAQLLYFARPEWADLRRGVDYYPESELIWLEADTVIRQKSRGKKSLDDFVRAFHGAPGGGPAVKTYAFEDVVAALNGVAPHDWAGFLRERIWKVAPRAPLTGIENGGWRLVYNDVKPELTKAVEETAKLYDFWYSLGILVQGDGPSGGGDDGIVRDVIPGMPAAAAGVGPGMRLVAVNGRRYSEKVLRDALRAARGGKEPIELLVENVEIYKTCSVEYHGGERYPHLERDAARPDVLSVIGQPRAAAKKK
jgi:predicted metalloprotease with PDZ domain